ncbi:MAG: hypothetical protein IH588_08635 [Anaerolineales bacterium]|nr:hypothetical protein [Anaerolineales bacterium]
MFPTFNFSGDNHLFYTYTNRTRPVSNADIIPALTPRALDSFSSSAVTSVFMLLGFRQ